MSAEQLLQRFDAWLQAEGPVAVCVREPLEPAAGKDAVLFRLRLHLRQRATRPTT